MTPTPSLSLPSTAPLDAFQETTITAARANILANSVAMVAHLNATLVGLYQLRYHDYVQNMQSGQVVPADRRNPPVPPNAWELAPANEDGFVFYQIGTTPVCPQGPAVGMNADNPQPNTAANMIMIGIAIPGGGGAWFQALKGDTFPSGKVTPPMTSADGVFGTFEKFGAPVGPGWYLKSS